MNKEINSSKLNRATDQQSNDVRSNERALKIPTFSTQQLFGSNNEIGIEHDNLLYRLRITKQGKLILNK